jgi:uncharacterized protein (TIGR02145 family)
MRTSVLTLFCLWALTTYSQIPDYVPTDGLVGWWPFNGNATDESGNGNDGTVNGAELTEDRNGEANKAYSFDGIDDFITCANFSAIFGQTNRTYVFWLKCSQNSPGGWVISTGPELFNEGGACAAGYHIDAKITNADCGFQGIGVGINCSQRRIQTIVNDNLWKHVVVLYDGSGISNTKVYINGNLVNSLYCNDGTDIYNFPNTLSINGLSFGKRNDNYTGTYFSGLLDDIGIWNRALTEEEIQQLYLAEVAEGCTDIAACNFNPDAGIDDGTCTYAQEFYDCSGVCLIDFDGDGACDELEVFGCTYTHACNYNSLATQDDGSCTIAETHYDCEGNCLLDLNGNGLCDLEEIAGCTSPEAVNYQVSATLDDGSCQYTCAGDINGNGNIDTNDLLIFLASYGNSCSGAGCMDPVGCNYNPEATFDLGYCEYPEEFYTCEGLPINDADGDGIPDELEVAGCTDLNAENYNPLATEDDGSCQYSAQEEEHTCGAASVHNPDLTYGTLTDIDGNTYKTIVIGNQEWMAENLNTSRYANGDLIPNITDNNQWEAQTQGAWCYYNNDIQNACPYGKLYNWYTTVDARNVCPTGWHVPSDAEWTVLTNYLGGAQVAGGKMKSTGTEHWWSPNAGATNEIGFSGLPDGGRNTSGTFGDIGTSGYGWSSTETKDANALYMHLSYNDDGVNSHINPKKTGFSVRCLRD